MKATLFLLITLSAMLMSFQTGENIINLTDGIKAKSISIIAKSNENSTHYTTPLKLIIKNLKPNTQIIKINNGLEFDPEDSSCQKLIITNEQLLTLSAFEEREVVVNAMCIQKNNSAPSTEIKYRLNGMSNPNLRKLTELIQKKKLFIPEAQYAVWVITDNSPIEEIAGFDTIAEKELMACVAEITGKPIPPRPKADDYNRNYYHAKPKISFGGSFEYKLSTYYAITIAMFDVNNIIVRELYKNERVSPGVHTFKYEFDISSYTDPVYYVKLIRNGVVMLSIDVQIPQN